MCGRMTLTRSGREIAEYFELAVGEEHVTEMDGNPLRARYNVAPSQQIVAVHGSGDDVRTLRWKQWGLIPSWSQSASMGGRLFNARSETAAEKPSFRAAWKRRRTIVLPDIDVVATSFTMKLDPVCGGRSANKQQLVFGQVEQDAVTDDVAVITARNHLLRFVDLETFKRVEAKMFDHFQRVGAFDINVHHVMSLIEKDAGFLPRPLLVAPVCKFGCNDRVHIRANLRVP